MKKLSNIVLGLVAVSFLYLTVLCYTVQAGIVFDKVITKTDKFTQQTHKEFITKSILNLDYVSIYSISPNFVSISFDKTPKSWDWLKQSSRTIYILVDGNLIKKKYRLKTDVWSSCVLESARITLTIDEALKISNAKVVEIKIGCCDEIKINQQFKDALKTIINN